MTAPTDGRVFRRHDVDRLDKIAFLHSETPIDGLTSEGAQARAWYVLSRLPEHQAAEAVDTRQALGAIIGFYAAVFNVDPQQVLEDVKARYGYQ